MSSLQDLIDEFEELEGERLEFAKAVTDDGDEWDGERAERYAYLESFALERLQRNGAFSEPSDMCAYGQQLWDDLGYEIPDAISSYVTVDYERLASEYLADLNCIEVADSDGDIVVIYTP